jgi:alpha-galactosidase
VAASRKRGKSGGAKVTFIGGGSAKFVSQLAVDLFLYQELQDVRICLMDVHGERLDRAGRLIKKIIQDRQLPATVETCTDQRRALAGSDYVINTFTVGGFDHYKSDGEIPRKHGVSPTVGHTIGPGAVFRLVRTAPVLREIAANLRAVAPDAWLLNYANPMAMNTWTLLDEGHQRTLGLGHSIQCAHREIAKWLGLRPEGMSYTAGGINHVDFYLTLEHEGRNVYPLLLQNKERILHEVPQALARFELLEYLGYWPAEGDWRQNVALAREYATETMRENRTDLENAESWKREVEEQLAGRSPVSYQRSDEYGAGIIHAMETNMPSMFYGNIRNHGFIENLPPQAVVEVPCHADAAGVVAERVGRIPTPLAAVMTPHILVHEMAVEGVRRKSRTLIRQAIQADPLTGAVLSLPQIRALTNELMEANREYLRDWPDEETS